jgi:hypothetical protein
LRLITTTTLLTAAVAGSAFLFTGGAAAGQGPAATGGGQILIDEGGAGDTIAFTAKDFGDGAKGQVQYVDRTGGTGQEQTVQHGTVTCIEVTGNVATIAGLWRDGTGFDLYVMDNGEGDGTDMIGIMDDDDSECDYDPNGMDAEEFPLARGNAQVRPGS